MATTHDDDGEMPAKRTTLLSDEVRTLVKNCGISRYRISKVTGIDESVLSRFVAGTHGMELATLDKLAEFLDLHITTGKRFSAPKGETKKGGR